jgi:hypothetical protein
MAQQRKTGFPLPTHRTVGRTLCDMRNALVTACVFVHNAYRPGGRPSAPTRLDRLTRSLDALRCRLDSAVFQEYSTLPHAAQIYYPDTPVVPRQSFTSLAAVCGMLADAGQAMEQIAGLLFAHYPVTLGDRAGMIARGLAYQAEELPYVVGPQKRRRTAEETPDA